MNKPFFHFNIRNMLVAMAGVLFLLLAVLLVADIMVFNQIRTTQQQQVEYRERQAALNEAMTAFNSASLRVHEAAVSGNLGAAAVVPGHIANTKDWLMKAVGEDQEEMKAVADELDLALGAGEKMIRAYLLEGREAGNIANLAPEEGFAARSATVEERFKEYGDHIQGLVAKSRQSLIKTEALGRAIVITGTAVLLVLALAAFALLYRKLMGSINRISDTVARVTLGDFSARCQVKSGDEMQVMADAFDNLLAARVSTMAQIERENDAINESIIRILEATGTLSQRDLRINVPVAEDVTGAIADSINGAVSDMAEVLRQVRQVSQDVHDSSGTVDQQAQRVFQVAQRNLTTVESTLKDLQQATASMEKVMTIAAMSHKIAGAATHSTSEGLASVLGATEGMNRIRESIQETAKRIKRLGERSQEISGIVGIIKDITERTHVLALNARIQASTAGEAGKGFSVVADEVKQLAESSRQATGQIAQLIQNIQIETNDTIATMEQTVTEVVKGTELSEKARSQMQETQHTTDRLAEAVRQIATSSAAQMKITKEITSRAEELRASAVNTQKEVADQRQQSRRLTNSSEQLAKAVAQFTLPEAA